MRMLVTLEFTGAGGKTGTRQVLIVGRGTEDLLPGDIGMSLEEARVSICAGASAIRIFYCTFDAQGSMANYCNSSRRQQGRSDRIGTRKEELSSLVHHDRGRLQRQPSDYDWINFGPSNSAAPPSLVPSTDIIFRCSAVPRIFRAWAYSGDAYHLATAALSGNSTRTIA